MKAKCEVEGCKNLARYKMYKTYPDGKKRWLHVCGSCEQEIGRENFNRAGGYLSAKEWEDLQAMRSASRIRV